MAPIRHNSLSSSRLQAIRAPGAASSAKASLLTSLALHSVLVAAGISAVAASAWRPQATGSSVSITLAAPAAPTDLQQAAPVPAPVVVPTAPPDPPLPPPESPLEVEALDPPTPLFDDPPRPRDDVRPEPRTFPFDGRIVTGLKLRPQPTPVATPPTPAAASPAATPVVASARPAPPLRIAARPNERTNPKPVYPQRAIRFGWVGTVVLDVDVTPSGTVAAIRIARTAGKKAFDRAAITAVKKWRFAPATQAGRPVADTRRFSFRFEPPARR